MENNPVVLQDLRCIMCKDAGYPVPQSPQVIHTTSHHLASKLQATKLPVRCYSISHLDYRSTLPCFHHFPSGILTSQTNRLFVFLTYFASLHMLYPALQRLKTPLGQESGARSRSYGSLLLTDTNWELSATNVNRAAKIPALRLIRPRRGP